MLKREKVTRSQQITCWHCASLIQGDAIVTIPANYIIQLGIDFPKSWHRACYEKNEAKLELELHGKG